MKRILTVLVLVLSTLTPAHADTQPSLVLIDSGINTNLFAPNIVTEVCVMEYIQCPNGKFLMEGAGASQLNPTTNVALQHGNQMMSVITKVNPSARVIPVRITGVNATGAPLVYTLAAVKSALDWVITNREKYNIKVVSLSQGRLFSTCFVPAGLAENIATLKASGVMMVSAAGNNGNKTAMMSPACLPDVISVGATDNPDKGVSGIAWDKKALPTIAKYSNGSPVTWTNGRWYTLNLDGSKKFTVGTSNATAAMSSWLLTNPLQTGYVFIDS